MAVLCLVLFVSAAFADLPPKTTAPRLLADGRAPGAQCTEDVIRMMMERMLLNTNTNAGRADREQKNDVSTQALRDLIFGPTRDAESDLYDRIHRAAHAAGLQCD